MPDVNGMWICSNSHSKGTKHTLVTVTVWCWLKANVSHGSLIHDLMDWSTTEMLLYNIYHRHRQNIHNDLERIM